MARRVGFGSLMTAIARDIERSNRRAIANRKRREREEAGQARATYREQLLAAREAERTEKEEMREQIRAEKEEAKRRAREAKEARENYLKERNDEVAEMNSELAKKIEDLCGILQHTLGVDDKVAFNSLLVEEKLPPFRVEKQLAVAIPPPDKTKIIETHVKEPVPILMEPPPPTGLAKLVPGAKSRHEKALQDAKVLHAAAEERYRKAMEEAETTYLEEFRKWKIDEQGRRQKLQILKAEYLKRKEAFEAKVQQRRSEVETLEKQYREGDRGAIVAYNAIVLERSKYPDDFPQEFRLAFVPESKQLVIDYELPPPSIIPSTSEFRYNKAKDTIEEKPRKPNESKELYSDIVASIALRTLHEILEADQGNHIEAAVFSGYVNVVDPATGKDIRPCLLSLRVTKEKFLELDLAKVDKKVCLRNLGAQVSPRPFETQPVKPIVEFDMVDKRFVQAGDMLADLESRPNLMDLNPFEFENLVTNLFQQMGLDTKLTRASRDGGVDAVAFDTRPVIGGKVVIQAKRYKDTVGVSAVRDLYGTMMNEGANKGILVTTSGYGPDAFEFAKDKPIELLDGGALLYLLGEVGVKARIVFPQE